MNRRYRVRDAIETIPWVSDTAKVTDIVFQLGLNDLRKGCSLDEIQEETLEKQMKYVKYFPNARQHLTAPERNTTKSTTYFRNSHPSLNRTSSRPKSFVTKQRANCVPS